MIKSKLIHLLRTLTKKEFKTFEKFITSPYFNYGRDLLPLYKVLKKYYPKFSDKNLNYENVYKTLYQGSEFDKRAYNLLSTLMSEMFKLGEKFIYEEHKSDPKEYYYSLAEREIQLGLKNFARKNLDNLERLIDNEKKEMEYFWWKQKLNEEKQNYFSYFTEHQHIAGAVKNRDINFITHTLIYASELKKAVASCEINFNAVISPALVEKFIDSFNIDKLIDGIRTYSFENKNIFLMYLYILKAETNDKDEESYYKFRKLHLLNQKNLSHYENYRLYNVTQSILSSLLILNNDKYSREYFSIYKEMVKNGYYKNPENPYMELHVFLAVVTLAASLKKTSWLNMFLKEKIKDIKPELRKSAYYYGAAHLCFIKSKYNEALDLIKKINIDILRYKYDLKYLQMKIYYEIGYYDELKYLIDSYYHFLKNNKQVSEQKKHQNLNFIKYLSKMVKIKQGYPDLSNDELRKELKSENNITGKKWLIEKLEDI